MSNWDGTERRTDNLAFGVFREMREWLDQHEKEEFQKHEALREEIRDWQQAAQRRHDETMQRIADGNQSTLSVVQQQNSAIRELHGMFKQAFPDGDPVKHRLGHEDQDKRDQEARDSWVKLKQHVINWAAVAIIGWGGVILWLAFLKGPK